MGAYHFMNLNIIHVKLTKIGKSSSKTISDIAALIHHPIYKQEFEYPGFLKVPRSKKVTEHKQQRFSMY